MQYDIWITPAFAAFVGSVDLCFLRVTFHLKLLTYLPKGPAAAPLMLSLWESTVDAQVRICDADGLGSVFIVVLVFLIHSC